MKKKPIKGFLKELKGENSDVAAIKDSIIKNFTATEIVDALVELSESNPVVEDTADVKPITLAEEDYKKLMQFFKQKSKRNRGGSAVEE